MQGNLEDLDAEVTLMYAKWLFRNELKEEDIDALYQMGTLIFSTFMVHYSYDPDGYGDETLVKRVTRSSDNVFSFSSRFSPTQTLDEPLEKTAISKIEFSFA